MLVSKSAKICVTPNAKYQICIIPNQNQNASQWTIGCVGSSIFALVMYISCCLCSFHLCWVPNANPVCSGIWALYIDPYWILTKSPLSLIGELVTSTPDPAGDMELTSCMLGAGRVPPTQ